MAPSPTHVLKPGVVHFFLFLTTAPRPPVYLTHQPVPLIQSSKKKNHKPTLSSPSPPLPPQSTLSTISARLGTGLRLPSSMGLNTVIQVNSKCKSGWATPHFTEGFHDLVSRPCPFLRLVPSSYRLSHTVFFFFFSWPCHVAFRTLVLQPGIKPRPLAVRLWSPNHWTTRKFPWFLFKSSNGAKKKKKKKKSPRASVQKSLCLECTFSQCSQNHCFFFYFF